jgi:hypothetical protein
MDVIAAACAYAVGADLFITNRPYLFDASWDAASGVLAVRPLDALPLLGLYLRAQDVFTVRQTYPGGPTGRINMDRGGFYTTATYDLLPSLGRWFGAVEAHSLAVSDDSVAQLAGSVVNRLQQALQDRDRVWIALNHPMLSDAGSDALDALDDVLLRLMGAIDITARVARAVIGLDEELSRSGWTSRTFLKAVRKKHRPLAALFDAGSPHRITLNVVSELRNTIHHTALPEIRINEWRGSQQTWVASREAQAPVVLAAADSLGGRQSWGVNEPTPGRFHLDPGRLSDQLIIHTANLILAVQDTTPVERLAGVIPGLSVDLTSELGGFGLDTATRSACS